MKISMSGVSTIAVVCGLAAFAPPAFAQTDTEKANVPAHGGDAETQGTEVVVTGSRIARRDFGSTSPIVTMGEGAIGQTGAISVDAALNQLPQVAAGATSTTNLPSNQGRSTVDLRGLGPTRTLVLLDGRRLVPSNFDGTVDVNIVPPSLIENVEVITGGASAVYGSDAIAGVVNFRLKRNFSGVEVDGQYGISGEGDLQTKSLNATFGGNFADRRGNAVLSLGYADRAGLFGDAREYSLISPRLQPQVPQGSYGIQFGSAANAPSQAALNALFGRYGVSPGTVTLQNLATTTFGGLGFNADGSLFAVADQSGAVNYRGNAGPTTGYSLVNATVGGLPGVYFNGAPQEYISIPLTRYSAFGAANYDVSDTLTFYGQASFSRLESKTQLGPIPAGGSTAALVVPVTNPFIPTDLATLLASRPDPTADFEIAKRLFDFPRTERNRIDTFQVTLGAKGKLGVRGWTWEVYGSYGKSDQTTTGTGYSSRRALDTLLRAPDGGVSLCAGGYNPFGINPLSEACRAYVNRTGGYTLTNDLGVVEGTIQGGLFELPYGEVRFAAGADYRDMSFERVASSIYNVEPAPAPNGAGLPDALVPAVVTSAKGSYNAKEIFGELLVPILKDIPGFRRLDLGLGYRYSDYSSIGGVHSYKVEGDWEPFDGLRFRAGYQRANRAPSLDVLFASTQQLVSLGSGANRDPCNAAATGATSAAGNAQIRSLCAAQGVPAAGASTPQFVQTVGVGNPDLKEETADTFTVGGVVQPKFASPVFSRLSLSVDYYQIKIRDAIGTLAPTDLVRACYNLDGSNPTYAATSPFCQNFRRAPNGSITQIVTRAENLSRFSTRGIDAQFDWTVNLADAGLGGDTGSLGLNVVANRLIDFQITGREGQATFDYAGTVGNSSIGASSHPKWKVATALSYTNGAVSTIESSIQRIPIRPRPPLAISISNCACVPRSASNFAWASTI